MCVCVCVCVCACVCVHACVHACSDYGYHPNENLFQEYLEYLASRPVHPTVDPVIK